MPNYLQKTGGTRKTPQSESLEGQTANSAGGFSWQVDDWEMLNRFLILGTEGGSYYATEQKLTRDAAKAVERCVKADARRVVDTIVAISDAGRAPKNDPALFALAMAAKLAPEQEDRAYAYQALPKVARIGTHLLHFTSFAKLFGGRGMGIRKAEQRWFLDRTPEQVAFQAVKYASRDGWAQRDVLRLARPRASEAMNDVLHYIVKGVEGLDLEKLPRVIKGTELIKTADKKQAAGFIREYKLPREVVPTEFLNEVSVWEALLEDMPMTAMIRNLNKMTSIGLLAAGSEGTKKVISQLGDEDAIKKARVHPIALLAALKTYQQGRGERGSLTWTPVAAINDALDAAFYLAFQNVEPTNKSIMLALDVSGSMGAGNCAGVPGLDPRTGAAAMALITANVEPNAFIVGFTAGESRTQHRGYGAAITPLDITPQRRLDDVVRYMSGLQFGGTDCALPMVYAKEQKLKTEAFIVYTDSETWAGNIHPKQALDEFRNTSGIAAKSIVVGMVGNPFTIADPNDSGMMDVVGFDTAAPAVMADFIR